MLLSECHLKTDETQSYYSCLEEAQMKKYKEYSTARARGCALQLCTGTGSPLRFQEIKTCKQGHKAYNIEAIAVNSEDCEVSRVICKVRQTKTTLKSESIVPATVRTRRLI